MVRKPKRPSFGPGGNGVSDCCVIALRLAVALIRGKEVRILAFVNGNSCPFSSEAAMNTRQAITSTMDLSLTALRKYIGDLSDAELLTRPGKGCNHIAFQLGHLIVSENGILNGLVPGAGVELPAGFREKHDKANSASDNSQDFCTKQQYLDLIDKVHAASVKALNATSDADLDQPAPESFRKMFPTAGNVWILIATHPMMHAGQFVPVRRALGKPVVI
jgi:hypothetical protein